jgi:hypothetical protein
VTPAGLLTVALAAGAATLCACDRASVAAEPRPAPSSSLGPALGAADLCVTSGALHGEGGELSVESPEFRAVAARPGDTDAELRFTYLGPTTKVAPLGSGRVRTQIGLKLRAKDACNLVYAMWRIDPGPEVVVQVKRNPSQRTSAECTNHGYRTVEPVRTKPVGSVTPGSTHVLRAAIHGSSLDVWVDGALAWQGPLGDDVLDLDGPVGVRSDNARFTFALAANGSTAAARACQAPGGE